MVIIVKSIKNVVIKEITINKSIFINYLVHVNSVDEVKNYLLDLRKKYSDANHHCFAYIIGKNQEIQKYSDDGEPSKTAGMPMIEVLKKHDGGIIVNGMLDRWFNFKHIETISIHLQGDFRLFIL